MQKDFPEFYYIYNKSNLGFSKAVNQGIKTFENSNFFLLINNDAFLSPNCLKELIKSSEDAAIVGPRIFYKDNPNIIWQGGGFFKKIKLGISVPEKNKIAKNNKNVKVDFLSGCVILIPKKAYSKIGLFDEKFYFYGEDLDYCLRAKKNGVKIIYVPKATAYHNIKKIEQSRTNPFVLENLAISYFLIIRKHFRILLLYGIFLFIFAYTPFRLIQIFKGGNNYKNIIFWFRGMVKGLKKIL